MLGLGPIAFAAPWVLLGLAALPVIWWLLRVTPPAPRVQRFPAIRLLQDLVRREETPDRTPWWLLLLRLVLAALVVVALARPILNPGEALPGSGPVLLAVDDGWAAARDWPARQRALADAIDRVERSGRPIVLLTTAPAADGAAPSPSGLMRPAEARSRVEQLTPKPWPVDRGAAAEALAAGPREQEGFALWLSDGLGGPDDAAFARELRQGGGLRVLEPAAGAAAQLVRPPSVEGAALTAAVERADAGAQAVAFLRLTGPEGRLLDRRPATFAEGDTTATARFEIPVELRNEATRLALEGEPTVGATVLLDSRWRRRPVGIVGAGASSEPQPLLSPTYYLERALRPFSELHPGELETLLDPAGPDLAAILMADTGMPTPAQQEQLTRWMEAGGVLVRFAGPLMAANPDTLVPVPLRFGDRVLSGALSWSEPQPLAPFSADSPFAGLAVADDVTVRRQVLAEPAVDLSQKTWARLADGTPLVTADSRGEGWLVLVHTTADADWSNLPLSGLFVEMLRRTVAMSEGVAGTGEGDRALEPVQMLDGFARPVPPGAAVQPIRAGDLAGTVVAPRHPPGFYGTEDQRRALNLSASAPAPVPIGELPRGVERAGYAAAGETPLMPWLLALALAVVAVDLLIGLALRGLLVPGRLGRTRTAASVAVLAAAGTMAMGAAALGPATARAQDDFVLRAANETLLAYVETGVPSVDDVSRAGLEGLSRVLSQRTAVEAAGAIGVEPGIDDLAFFSFLYWPVVPEQPPLDDAALSALNAYLTNGGTIVFDTRDRSIGGAADLMGGGPGAQRLRQLAEGLDIPPLEPVPPDHVLTKAFYLMQDFPGRYAGGEVWVQAGGEVADGDNDGVSPVVIGAVDWAGAWAIDGQGRPLYATVPGGERQREMAFRFGVNLVMYALTGNYKADQVHVPAILERLGQ